MSPPGQRRILKMKGVRETCGRILRLKVIWRYRREKKRREKIIKKRRCPLESLETRLTWNRTITIAMKGWGKSNAIE